MLSKEKRLKDLYNEYMKAYDGKEIVLGEGNIDTKIILIGEAPGKDEVKMSKPFVGAAGKNLLKFLEILGLGRDSIYITNAIKYRLSKINPQSGRIINRPAKNSEIDDNRRYLLEEITIIQPKYIVTLGNVPLKAITNDKGISIGKVHGKLNDICLNDYHCKLFSLYHPASIIYNRGLESVYNDDILKLRNNLNVEANTNGII